MDKWFIVSLILVGVIGLGYSIDSGLIDVTPIDEKPVATTARQVDLVLEPSVKEALEDKAIETITEEKCLKEEMVCIEYDCLEFDEKTQTCLKQGEKCLKEELQCIESETVETEPIITITPLPNGCYNIVSEPYLHRYNTCIPENMNIEQFVENDLKLIAEHSNQEKGKGPQAPTENIEIKIK